MKSYYPIIFSVVIIGLFGLLQVLFFRLFNKRFWDKKWLRLISLLLPLAGIVGVSLWAIGEYHTLDYLVYPGAILAVLVFVLEFCLIISLPLSGVFNFINWLWEKQLSRLAKDEKPIDKKRRLVLQSAAAAVPLLTLSTGAFGVARAMSDVKVFKKEILINNLPDEINGLKILHLSDLHLRHYVTLDDLQNVLNRAAEFQVDLTLITGDIADDLNLLGDAIQLIDALKPTLGSYACLGNHEYFRGDEKVIRIFEKSPVPLLIDRGQMLKYKSKSLFLGGLDDPRFMGVDHSSFFKTAIDKTLVDRDKADFTILMSHRPDALNYASEKEVNLTLAGHTHGAQVGFNNRSFLESYFPDQYLWGHYQLKQSHLYTSSGVGHWFPFRLGCPAEAPVIELKKA